MRHNRLAQLPWRETRTAKPTLFDLGGTLIDNKAYHILVWRELFRRHGHLVREDSILRTFGQTSPHVVQMRIHPELNSGEVAALASEREELYRDLTRTELTLLPGARELLLVLHHAHHGFALVTSVPPKNTSMVLRILEIASLFDVTVNRRNIARSRPDLEIFLLTAYKMAARPPWSLRGF